MELLRRRLILKSNHRLLFQRRGWLPVRKRVMIVIMIMRQLPPHKKERWKIKGKCNECPFQMF